MNSLICFQLWEAKKLFKNSEEVMEALADFIDGRSYNSLKENTVTAKEVSAEYFSKQLTSAFIEKYCYQR
ncbi:MAG: hypothetical protein R2827_02100 [Bdellovibrionales bacterium]